MPGWETTPAVSLSRGARSWTGSSAIWNAARRIRCSRWLIDIPRGVLGGENQVSQGRRERQYSNVLTRPRTLRDDVFAAAATRAVDRRPTARSGQARVEYRSTI